MVSMNPMEVTPTFLGTKRMMFIILRPNSLYMQISFYHEEMIIV